MPLFFLRIIPVVLIFVHFIFYKLSVSFIRAFIVESILVLFELSLPSVGNKLQKSILIRRGISYKRYTFELNFLFFLMLFESTKRKFQSTGFFGDDRGGETIGRSLKQHWKNIACIQDEKQHEEKRKLSFYHCFFPYIISCFF